LLSSSSLFQSLPFASGGKWKEEEEEEEEKVKSSSTFSWRTSEQKNRFLLIFSDFLVTVLLLIFIFLKGIRL
jgi:uncharacterized integral membrane protein